MSKLKHAFFGQLDTDALDGVGPIWGGDIAVEDMDFDVQLWADPGMALDAALLDQFAAQLSDLLTLDERARTHLERYLEQDRLYIEEHVGGLPDNDKIVALAPDGDAAAVNVAAFVAAMKLTSVNLWLNEASAPIVLDYMIDRENSDEILAVKCAADGQLIDVVWES